MPNAVYNPYTGWSGAPTTPAPGSVGLPNYNANPSPTAGQGPYGLVPGTIGIPPSAWQQLTSLNPALGNTTQLTNNILSEIQGDINPQALKNMQDAAARFGVSSGMPGSNAIPGTLANNANLRNIGLDTLQVQQQGLKDYNSLLGSLAGLQTPQSLAAEIAAHNAQLRAAPDPTSAANQQLANYWAALNAMRGPGGGTGRGAFTPGGGTQTGSGALGFGFGTLGQAQTPTMAGTTMGGFAPDQLYPGTEVTGLPNLDTILGAQNPYYGQTPSPIDIGSYYGADASNPDYWSWDQSAQPTIDPNAMSEEEWMYNMGGA